MEYLPGLTLHELVRQAGPLPPERVVYILRQVCGSLQEAHGIGLIHRDIKPQNIMLCERGGQWDVVKVLDFGLVKQVADAQAPQLTADFQVSGTPLYIAPEVWTKPQQADARADIYALGVVGLQPADGQRPVRGGQRGRAVPAGHHCRSAAALAAGRTRRSRPNWTSWSWPAWPRTRATGPPRSARSWWSWKATWACRVDRSRRAPVVGPAAIVTECRFGSGRLSWRAAGVSPLIT